MSFDPPADTAKWVENQKFPFEVWTDSSRVLAVALGAADDVKAEKPRRVSAILDAEGKVLVRYDTVGVMAHPAEVLEDAKRVLKK